MATSFTPRQVEQAHEAVDAIESTHARVSAHIPPGRERSMALTKLDEAVMWAERALQNLEGDTE